MAVLNITKIELEKLIGQVENDEIGIDAAWNSLGEKGDAYAFLAGAIVSDDTDNMSGLALVFYAMVKNVWENTDAGDGVWGGEVFFGVGKIHLLNYLKFLKDHEVAGGYTLPTSIDIEASYKSALNEYGLLPDTAIDAHFSVIDYFLGDGGGNFCEGDFSWAQLTDLANLAMGGPRWEQDRIEFNSKVFIDDIDPVDAVVTLGRTIIDTFDPLIEMLLPPAMKPLYWALQLADEVIDYTMEDFAKQNAVKVLYKYIDNSLTSGQLDTLLQAGANNDRLAFSELIDRLGRIFKADLPSSKDNSSQLFTSVKTISDLYKAGGWSLSIKIMGDDAASLASGNGADALAYRYALVNLNPFAVIGDASIYSNYNQNGELDLYDADTGEGFLTNKYLEDRAKMLAWKQQYDIDSKSYTSEWNSWSVAGDWDFIDYSTQIDDGPLKLSIDGLYLASTDNFQIAFGSAYDDTLTGQSLVDHLYGGGGNDTIYGYAGNDYIEGNAGNDHLYGGADTDTLLGGANNDTLDGGTGNDTLNGGSGTDTYYVDGIDTIIDSDGDGVIYADTGDSTLELGGEVTRIAGSENIYEDVHGNTYILDGNNLRITVTCGSKNSTVIINNYTPGRFGIQFENEEEVSDPGVPSDALWIDANATSFNKNYFFRSSFQNSRSIAYWGVDYYSGVNETSLVPAWQFMGGDNDDRLIGAEGLWWDGIWGAGGDDYIYGGDSEATDILSGNAGSDTILGGAGMDFIHGDHFIDHNEFYTPGGTDSLEEEQEGAENYLDGQDGDDWIGGGKYQDTILGGEGSDMLAGGAGNDFILGGADADTILGDSNVTYEIHELSNSVYQAAGEIVFLNEENSTYEYDDVIDGGDGDDFLAGELGDDVVYGGDGNDKIQGDYVDLSPSLHGDDSLFGGAGEDLLIGGGGDDYLDGGADNDELQGDAVDIAPSFHGNDTLYGREGNDLLVGLGGNDYLDGGDGNDEIQGDYRELDGSQHGDDSLFGGMGVDLLIGDGGDDYLDGGSGNDELRGDAVDLDSSFHGNDTMFGREGNDLLVGFGGNDYLDGGEGDDELQGDYDGLDVSRHGDDQLYGGAGSDSLWGDGGNDRLYGEIGNDTLHGGVGNDLLEGGVGNDHLWGEEGSDTFSFTAGNGIDIIYDADGTDKISFSGISLSGITTSLANGGDGNTYLAIHYGANDVVYIKGGLGGTIQSYEFSDVVITTEELISNTLTGPIEYRLKDSGTAYGSSDNDVLVGSEGDDKLYGQAGADILAGDMGDDLLEGGLGQDNYRIGRGTGKDLIIEEQDNSGTIQLLGGSSIDELVYDRQGDDLYVHFADSRDGAVIQNFYADEHVWLIKDDLDGSIVIQPDTVPGGSVFQQPASADEAWDYFENQIINYYEGLLKLGCYTRQQDGTFTGSFTDSFSQTHDHKAYYHKNYTVTIEGAAINTDDALYVRTLNNYETTLHDSWQTEDTGTVEYIDTTGGSYFISGESMPAGSQFVNFPGSGGGVPISGDMVPVYGSNDEIDPLTGYTAREIIGYWVYPDGAPGVQYRDITETHNYYSYESLVSIPGIVAGDSDNEIRVGSGNFNLVDAGGGNDIIDARQRNEYGIVSEQITYQNSAEIDTPNGGFIATSNAPGSLLYGNAGDDILIGGSLEDMLIGGTGSDYLAGGVGNDTYLILDTAGGDIIFDDGWTIGGHRQEDTIVLPDGITLDDLTLTWGDTLANSFYMGDWWGRVQSVHTTLNLSWDGSSGVTVILPHSDQNAGTGIDFVQFSNGDRIGFSELMDLAGNNPGVDSHQEDNLITGSGLLFGGTGNDYLMLQEPTTDPLIESADSCFFGLSFGGGSVAAGGAGRDGLEGSQGDDILIGGAIITDYSFDVRGAVGGFWDEGNLFRGGAGDDEIWATSGSDIFEFNIGDGSDTVTDYLHFSNDNAHLSSDSLAGTDEQWEQYMSGHDTLRFGPGILPDDIEVSENPENSSLIFEYVGAGAGIGGEEGFSGNVITFRNWVHGEFNQLDRVEFSDGTVWDQDDIYAMLNHVDETGINKLLGDAGNDQLNGGIGYDFLYGDDGDDVLDGGIGDDVMVGGSGDDTYLFSRSGGQDVIYDAWSDDHDSLSFTDVDYNELIFSRLYTDLVIGIVETNDQVTIKDWFLRDGSQLDTIETRDLVLQNDQINQLVNSLAVCEVFYGPGGDIACPDTNMEELRPTFVSYFDV